MAPLKSNAQARAQLLQATGGLMDVIPISVEPRVVGIVCTVKPPPSGMVDKTTGNAQFNVRLDRRSWEALRTLVDNYFLTQ